MTSTHVNPDHCVTALVDVYDEEAGCGLSRYGREEITRRLIDAGYVSVTYIPASEMGEYVNACNGIWYEAGMGAPREGWNYFRRVDAEELEALGIGVTDAMWEA